MEQALIINQQEIKLTIIQQSGICTKCQQKTELRLIGQNFNQTKKYCEICSREFLTRLNIYQFTSKELIIKEIKELLNKQSFKLWVDYYSCKKPYCVPCLNLGIKQQEFKFCSDNCLVKNFIKYHGHNYLLKNYESF